MSTLVLGLLLSLPNCSLKASSAIDNSKESPLRKVLLLYLSPSIPTRTHATTTEPRPIPLHKRTIFLEPKNPITPIRKKRMRNTRPHKRRMRNNRDDLLGSIPQPLNLPVCAPFDCFLRMRE